MSRFPRYLRLSGLATGLALIGVASARWDWLQPFVALLAGPALLLLAASVLAWSQRGRLPPALLVTAVASLLAPALLYGFAALTARLNTSPASPLYRAFFLLQVAVYVGA